MFSFNASSKTQKRYSTEKITKEEVMETMDMFQSRLGKKDEFGWWDLEIVSADTESHFFLDGVQRSMSNSRSSFDIGGFGTSVNERKS